MSSLQTARSTPQPLPEGVALLSAVALPELAYLCRAVDDGLDATARIHPVATSTCLEKAALLAWPPERVVKTLYLGDGAGFVVVVLPELRRRLDLPALLVRFLQLSRRRARRFHLGACPAWMEMGTCSPLPALDDPVTHILVHDADVPDALPVDISIGGRGPAAHRVSCHIRYPDLVALLRNHFGRRVVVGDFRPHLAAR